MASTFFVVNKKSVKKKQAEKQYPIAIGVNFAFISGSVFYLHSTEQFSRNTLLALPFYVISATSANGWHYSLIGKTIFETGNRRTFNQ